MEGAGAPRERRCWPRAGTPHGDLLQRPGARAMGPCRTPTVSHTHLASCSQHETEPAGGDAGDVAGGRRERGEGGGSGAGKRHSTPPTHPPTHTTPHSSPTTGAALLALVLALALYNWPGRGAGELSSCNCAGLSGGSAAGDTAAPEGEGGTIAVSCCSSMSVKRVPPYRAGSINATFGVTHDWRGRARAVRAAGGMVAADHGRCSEEGAKVLGLGGNAVDAAITTALCQGVYNPMASGVGGGHFMLIRCAGRGNGLARSLEIAAAPRAAPFPPTHPAPPPGQAAQRHCRGDRCARGGPRQGQRDNVCWCDEFSCWLARSRGGRGAMHARAARSLHLHRAARRLGDRRAGGGGAARAQVRGCTRARAAGGMAASSPPPPPPPLALRRGMWLAHARHGRLTWRRLIYVSWWEGAECAQAAAVFWIMISLRSSTLCSPRSTQRSRVLQPTPTWWPLWVGRSRWRRCRASQHCETPSSSERVGGGALAGCCSQAQRGLTLLAPARLPSRSQASAGERRA